MKKTKRAARTPRHRELCRLARLYVEQQGATPVGESCLDGARYYDYTLPTPLGTLVVHLNEETPTLNCRFEDVDRACARLNPLRRLGGTLNPFSGKYNTAADAGGSAQDGLAHFRRHLSAVLNLQEGA